MSHSDNRNHGIRAYLAQSSRKVSLVSVLSLPHVISLLPRPILIAAPSDDVALMTSFSRGSAAGAGIAICREIQSKRKISSVRENDESLADNQGQVAYAHEFYEYHEDGGVSHAPAEERQVARRFCSIDAFYLEENIDVQGDLRKERDKV
jgi:hypothetical protein